MRKKTSRLRNAWLLRYAGLLEVQVFGADTGWDLRHVTGRLLHQGTSGRRKQRGENERRKQRREGAPRFSPATAPSAFNSSAPDTTGHVNWDVSMSANGHATWLRRLCLCAVGGQGGDRRYSYTQLRRRPRERGRSYDGYFCSTRMLICMGLLAVEFKNMVFVAAISVNCRKLEIYMRQVYSKVRYNCL